MKNRAKCKLCEEIIESLHSQDYQLCRCGHIFVDGGDQMLCGARDWVNFIRVDDNGNEIIPKIVDKNSPETESQNAPPLSKLEKLDFLKRMISSFENLPKSAYDQPITHYDLQSALLIIYEILKEC